MPQRDVSAQHNNRKEQASSTRWWGVRAGALVTSENKIINLPKNKNKNKKGSPKRKDKREIK